MSLVLDRAVDVVDRALYDDLAELPVPHSRSYIGSVLTSDRRVYRLTLISLPVRVLIQPGVPRFVKVSELLVLDQRANSQVASQFSNVLTVEVLSPRRIQMSSKHLLGVLELFECRASL